MKERIIKVACVGDSITYGQTLEDIGTESYPAVLEKMLSEREEADGMDPVRYLVGNFGVSGTGLWRHGHYRYVTTSRYQDAVSWGADIIVICLGTNDTVNVIDETFENEFAEDYIALMENLKTNSPNAKVFIARIPPVPSYPGLAPSVCRINGAIRRAARECEATLIDFSKPFLGREDLFSDGVHPNRLGARELASLVFDALVKGSDEPEDDRDSIGIVNFTAGYSAEDLLNIDEERTVLKEDEAMDYLNSFWRVMEKPGAAFPVIDPNDLRTLFRKRKELILLPTIRAYREEDLMGSTVSVLSSRIKEGDVVLLTFATTEDDWRLEGILYENFNETITAAFGQRVKLFFAAAIPDEKKPYAKPLQAGIMILRCGESLFPLG